MDSLPKLEKNLSQMLARIESVKHLAVAKGFDLEALCPCVKALEDEIKDQACVIREELCKPIKPRNAKKILDDIRSKKELTPELLAEIEALGAKKKKSKSDSNEG